MRRFLDWLFRPQIPVLPDLCVHVTPSGSQWTHPVSEKCPGDW